MRKIILIGTILGITLLGGVVFSQSAPSAPSPLQATAVSGTEIDLSWQNVSNETGYLVYRSLDPNFSNATIQQAAANTNTFSDTGLSPGTTYYYQVYVCNAAGCTGSNVAPATTQGGGVPPSLNNNNSSTLGGGTPHITDALNPPSTFDAQKRSSCAIDLTWTARPTSGPQYKVEYTTAGDFFGGGTALVTTPNVDYIHKGLTPGTAYRYRIQSMSADGTQLSAYKASNPATVTPPALPSAPAVPTAFLATSTGSGQIDLSWKSATLSQYGGFVLERSVAGSTSWVSLPIPYSSRFDRDGGGTAPLLDVATVYLYRLRSFESAELCSETTRNYSAYTAELTVPTSPSGLKSSYTYHPPSAGIPDQINLSWIAGNGQDSVEIWRKSDTETDFSKLVTNPAPLSRSAVSYDDKAVQTNGFYTYKVRGCASDSGVTGCSAFSNPTSKRVANAPQNLTAVITALSGTSAEVTLTWENTFAGRGNYVVERAEKFPVTDPLHDFTMLTDSILAPADFAANPTVSYLDKAVSLGKHYTYRVKADFIGTTSEYSNTADANLNIDAVKGWAWDGNGLGWTRLSNDSSNSSWGPQNPPTVESVPYTVYKEKDTGLMCGTQMCLGGYAWNPYGGWLSFNETSGCPMGGSCRAQVAADGTVTGWAKFVSETKSGVQYGLNQWVSLSPASGGGSGYGLVLATTTESGATVNVLRGFAWGGDVVGWMSFGGPILVKVTPNVSDGTQATVQWKNPMDYTKVEIWRSKSNPQDPYNKKTGYPLVPIRKFDSSVSSDAAFTKRDGGDKTFTDTGLDPNTTYGYFLRGYPE